MNSVTIQRREDVQNLLPATLVDIFSSWTPWSPRHRPTGLATARQPGAGVTASRQRRNTPGLREAERSAALNNCSQISLANFTITLYTRGGHRAWAAASISNAPWSVWTPGWASPPNKLSRFSRNSSAAESGGCQDRGALTA